MQLVYSRAYCLRSKIWVSNSRTKYLFFDTHEFARKKPNTISAKKGIPCKSYCNSFLSLSKFRFESMRVNRLLYTVWPCMHANVCYYSRYKVYILYIWVTYLMITYLDVGCLWDVLLCKHKKEVYVNRRSLQLRFLSKKIRPAQMVSWVWCKN